MDKLSDETMSTSVESGNEPSWAEEKEQEEISGDSAFDAGGACVDSDVCAPVEDSSADDGCECHLDGSSCDDVEDCDHEKGSSDLDPHELGRRGERAARLFLERRGHEILDINWTCFAGEVDIVSIDDDTLCFIEVKTRRGASAGFPEEAVTARKRSRYEKIAACYLKEHDFADMRVRFDVISIMVIGEHRAFLRMHTNAFGTDPVG